MPPSLRPLLPLLLIALAAVGGCSESVPPTLDTGRPFTLWGVLNPTEDLQGIRVVPIGLVLEEGGPSAEPLDAVVESVDLETGARVTWRDSVITFAGGDVGHVFVADFRPRFDAPYEVTATRSDGAVSRVRVRTPPAVEALPLELGPVTFILPVLWTQAPSLNVVRVTYAFQYAGCAFGRETFDVVPPAYPFEFGWRVDLPLADAAGRLRGRLGTNEQLALVSVTVDAFVSNTEWRPIFGTPYDPEIYVEPGTLENVENGFGFVGAGFIAPVEWRPEPDVTITGFTTSQSLGCTP